MPDEPYGFWEYEFFVVETPDPKTFDNPNDWPRFQYVQPMLEKLNEIDKQGWEAVRLNWSMEFPKATIYAKRRIRGESDAR